MMYRTRKMRCDNCDAEREHYIYDDQGIVECSSCATRRPYPPLSEQEREWQDFTNELLDDREP